MSLMSDVVATINKVTKDLGMQASGAQQVTLRSYTGDAGKGDPSYSSKKYDAVVKRKIQQVRTFSGNLSSSSCQVTFLDPNVVVREHDRIALADGTENEVLNSGGPVDSSGQLITEAYL